MEEYEKLQQPLFNAPGSPRAILAVKLVVLFFAQLFLGGGILLFLKCGLGADPLTMLYDGLSASFGISYAMASAVCNISVFLIALLFARRYFGIGSVIVTFTLSLFVGFFDWLLSRFDFLSMPLWQLLLLVLLAQVLMSFGMALSVWADFGMNCFLAVLYQLSDVTKIRFKALKIINDVLFALAGFLLGGVLGVGTVFSALTTGIMIAFFKNGFDRFLFRMPPTPRLRKRAQNNGGLDESPVKPSDT